MNESLEEDLLLFANKVSSQYESKRKLSLISSPLAALHVLFSRKFRHN